MVGTEFLKGQGLGNQLFCYVTARAIAEENGYEFATAGQERLAVNVHSNAGMYFMDMDLGHAVTDLEKKDFSVYEEAEVRLYMGNSKHDIEHGCYVAGADEKMCHVADNTLLYGNMQDESYFYHEREKLKDWLKVKPEYESYEYSRENLCIINMRGGEYADSPELCLRKKYWLDGIRRMKEIRTDMEFMIVTDDVAEAQKTLPGIPAYHFSIDKDYVTLKNAYYLLLSNSSFAFFPAYTSETVKFVIAPKYWARHNMSDGYWASEQNIYERFHYMDRRGRLFTAEECRSELERYQAVSGRYKRVGQKPQGIRLWAYALHSKYTYGRFRLGRICRGLERRAKCLFEKRRK